MTDIWDVLNVFVGFCVGSLLISPIVAAFVTEIRRGRRRGSDK